MKQESLVGKKLKSFSIIRKIGAGTYSIVYEAIDSKTKQRVAIKAISFKQINKKPKLRELVETQIRVLRSCQNQNVIKHIDSFKSENNVFIVIEYCDGGDVQQYLKKKSRLPEEEATDILKQILNGFRGLHEVKAMHRDFKLANLLLHNKIIKIGDLGFAKQLEKQKSLTKTQLGTEVTMAPQILDGKEYGMYADIWSIGIVFYQMIFGKYLFTGPSDREIRRQIQIRNIQYPKSIKISQNAKDFIERCLTIDPKLRISWSEIYSHPLIANNSNLLFNLSISKQKMQLNKSFYQENEIQTEKKFMYPEKQEFITFGYEMPEMKADELEEESNLQMLKSENQAKKKKEAEIFQYEQILLKKRNNIMFMFKYFVPKVAPFIHEINAIHCIALFFICKKTLIELQNLVNEINQKKSSSKENSSLKSFFKSTNCLKLLNLFLEDIDMIKQQSCVYMQEIKNSPQIEMQMSDITKWENHDYSSLLHEIFDGYWFQIAENVESFKCEKRLNTIIEVLKALEYYYTTDEVSIEVFNLILETLDYEDYKAEVIRKIYDIVVSVN